MSTNSVLPGKSRLFPCSYTVSLNFFFWCAFLCIFALFLSHVYRVKKLFFCSNFLELSSCALSCCKTLFYSTFRNIQRIKLFFVRTFAHFMYFPLCCLLLKNQGKTVTKTYTPQSLFRRFSIFISSLVSLSGLLSGWNAFDNVR